MTGIAEYTIETRQLFNMSQSKLAEAAGCDSRTIGRIEAGQGAMTSTFINIADAIGDDAFLYLKLEETDEWQVLFPEFRIKSLPTCTINTLSAIQRVHETTSDMMEIMSDGEVDGPEEEAWEARIVTGVRTLVVSCMQFLASSASYTARKRVAG